jgi:uncharacterized protein DUF3142
MPSAPPTRPPTLSRRRWLAGATGLTVVGALGAGAYRRLLRRSGPLEQQAYVWNYAWTDAVKRAVEGAGADVRALVVLGAEVRWGARGEAQTRVVRVDGPALRQASVPVGLGLRIHALEGDPGEQHAAPVLAAIAAARAQIEGAGLRVGEVQLDFDCATRRLDAYRRWLDRLRPAAAGARLTMTALPTWLTHASFAGLASAVDGYVLQVHGLDDPRGALFDRGHALRAVALAGALGRPFRLALPTYAYRIAFDAAGRAAGAAAEGPAGGWGEGWQERRVAAPPAEIAALVRALTASRPASLEGLLWYRLPVEGDRQNWSMATLRAVQQGRAPAGRLRAEAAEEAGLWTLSLSNDGDDDVELRGAARVRWRGGRRIASDALGGLRERREGDEVLWLEATTPWRLSPGERRVVGWLRLEPGGQVQIDVDGGATG